MKLSLVVRLAAAVLAASLATGCSIPSTAAPLALPTAVASPVGATMPVAIELDFGGRVVPAVIDGTDAGREFASMLPLVLRFDDRFGQAKVAAVPMAIESGSARSQPSFAAGEIVYWPGGKEIAIHYAADVAAGPAGGLISLGTIDADLDVVAAGATGVATVALAARD